MTEIKVLNTNYSISKENETFKINGTCNYSDRIESLEEYYVGNIFYQEFGDDNSNVNYTVNKEYSSEINLLLQSIIEDINDKLKVSE